MSDSPAVVLYDAAGVAMAVSDGVAIPVGTKTLLIAGSDGTNARTVKVSAAGRVVTDGSEVTSLISAASLPLPAGAATQATLAALLTELQLKADLTETQPVSAASLPLPAGAATESTLLTRATEATLLTRLSKADFEARINTLGQKTMALSTPVTMASNQTPLPVTFTPADSRTGVSGAFLTLGGGTAGVLVILRATTYTEPAAAAQRSVASASANDTAAGTGARSVRITYFDNSGNGPLFETVTLNGTTAVNTVATDIRFIESMEVVTAGSLFANAGIITLYGATGGGGGTVGSIGVGTIVTGVGDNRTVWAHHYVAAGYTAQLATFSLGIQSGGGNTSGRFLIRMTQPLVANSADVTIGDVVLVNGSYLRQFQYPLEEPGFARLTAYCIPAVNNTTVAASFDWSETPT